MFFTKLPFVEIEEIFWIVEFSPLVTDDFAAKPPRKFSEENNFSESLAPN